VTEEMARESSRDPTTGLLVLGAVAGRIRFEETVRRADARAVALRSLRQEVGSILVGHLDRLANGAPAELVVLELIRVIDALAGRHERELDAEL
jgi:hypothetical protein